MPIPSTRAATTLENLKQYLKIDSQDTSKDDLLCFLLDSCTQSIEVYLGRNIITADIPEEPHDTDTYPSNQLQLCNYPVKEITQILQDGALVPTSAVKTNKNIGIITKHTQWRGTVLVSYKAGLAANAQTVPPSIQLALCMWVAAILAKQDNNGIKSESLGDYSASYYDELQIPSQIKSLLDYYGKASV